MHFEIFAIYSLRRKLSPTCMLKWPGRSRVQIMCNTWSAYHLHHAVCHLERRDSSAIKFDLSFILLAETINWWRGEENQSIQRKSPITSFRKCHILKPENSKPQMRGSFLSIFLLCCPVFRCSLFPLSFYLTFPFTCIFSITLFKQCGNQQSECDCLYSGWQPHRQISHQCGELEF